MLKCLSEGDFTRLNRLLEIMRHPGACGNQPPEFWLTKPPNPP